MRKLFDLNGNLRESKILSWHEVEVRFGFNDLRRNMLSDLFLFLKLFKSLGCTNVYLVGSFVTTNDQPNDIDVCVDITFVDYKKLKSIYPELLKEKTIDKIRKEHKIHFALFFDFATYELLDYFRNDRDGNSRGVVKISLFDIEEYDK